MAVGEPLRVSGPYDFGASTLVKTVFEQGQAQFLESGYGQPPPQGCLLARCPANKITSSPEASGR